MRTRTRRTGIIGLALTASLFFAACGGDDDDASAASAPAGTEASDTTDQAASAPESSGPVELSLVAYSVPKAANEKIEALFSETPQGAETTWIESYGGSGDQSRAVVAGLEADYVHFSLEPDVTRLVNEGLVAEDWNAGPTKGIVSSSVVVLAVRPGNPKGITG